MFIIMTPQKVSKIPLLYHNNNEYQNYYIRKQLRSPHDRLEIKSWKRLSPEVFEFPA